MDPMQMIATRPLLWSFAALLVILAGCSDGSDATLFLRVSDVKKTKQLLSAKKKKKA